MFEETLVLTDDTVLNHAKIYNKISGAWVDK